MDDNQNYKYEVAFSFLAHDESLAQRLNDLLQPRLSTFFYPERQLTLAGTDGEVTLKKAFGSEARVVVILYRENWGTTPWTRIEQDAIRDRAYDEGYDFCLLIPLDQPQSKPPWFPKNRIWIGLERWGIEAAASVVEARVQEAGGVTREESVPEGKARLEREVVAAERRNRFLDSEEAVKPATEEVQIVLRHIEEMATTISTPDFPLVLKRDNASTLTVESYGFVLQAQWHRAYRNSLMDSGLHLRLLERKREVFYDRQYNELHRIAYHFSLDESDNRCWRPEHGRKEFLTSKQVADDAVKMIIEKVAEFRKRGVK